MAEPRQVLQEARVILLVDWPSKDVPETLAAAGYCVIVKGGPEPDQYASYEVDGGDVVRRPLGCAPERADILYCHRPIEELPDLARLAATLGASTVWFQSGQNAAGEKDPKGCWLPERRARKAEKIVRSFGLGFIMDHYVVDAVRDLGASP